MRMLFWGGLHNQSEADGVVRAKRPARLPVLLTRDEVRAVIRELHGAPRLMAVLLYGTGLRVLQCARLRIKDVDFGAHQIVVRGGKGDRDRVTMLPDAVSTTMVYTHVLNRGPAAVRSPADRGLGL